MNAEFAGSLVALVTPMTVDGRIDTTAYERLLQYHLEQGTDGFVIGGTTGESPTITVVELAELIRIAIRRVEGRVPVIAGSGTNSTASTIALSQSVCEAGANACLVVTPYYNKPTQEGLFLHYNAVANTIKAPLILYNVPGRTGTDLLPDTVRRLSSHPRIVAIKEATGDIARTQEIIRLCGESIDVLSGDDATALALMEAGAAGVISVSANVAPAAMAKLCRAALTQDWEQARRIDSRLRDLHRELFIEPNPIPVKYAVWRMGLIEPGLRLPMTPLETSHQEQLVAAMINAGLEVSA